MNTRNWLSSNRIVSRASGLFSPKRRDSLTSRALGTLGLAQKEQIISRTSAAGLICGALATGAALTFLFDPTTGRRRRHLAGQRLYSSARRIGDATDVTARDLANRSRGLFATVMQHLFCN